MPWYENRTGKRLWYEDRAAGRPVVLIHGWCMSSAVWKYQFDDLDASRVIAPDLRGHGLSRGTSGFLDFESFANDLVDLCELLDLEHVVLVGWSMGGQIALQAYSQLSGRLAGMVLVSATPCFTTVEGYPYGLSATESRGMRLKVERNLQRALEGFYSRLFVEGELENHPFAGDIKQLLSSVTLPDTAAVLDALDALARTDMRPILDSIATPTLILNGTEDRICLPEASSYLKERIPRAEQVQFPHCGHAPFLTQSPQFNAELLKFVRSISEQNA